MLPAYTAVSVCWPPVSWPAAATNVAVATPATTERLLVPSVVVPSLKVTVPVGNTPLNDGVTVARMVTGWPNTEGLGTTVVIVVVVGARFTTWLTLGDV